MNANFNPNKQHTLSAPVKIEGKGLHTGLQVELIIEPAEIKSGISFKRVDLEGQPTIKADCDKVTDTSRGTTLENGEAKISTVEHLLAALTGCGIDNAIISINAPEVPILDGSAAPFVKSILEAGITEQDAEKEWITIDEPITFRDEAKDSEMTIIPSDEYSITSMIDFNSPILGCQYAQMQNLCEFNDEFASSRTFTFLHELEPLLQHNLIKGGDLNNAIVVVNKEISEETKNHLAKLFNKDPESLSIQKGYLNNLELRHPNEPARHKLLDIVGDLALVGIPFKGKVIANKPGHKSNVELAKLLKKYLKQKKLNKGVPVYDATKEPLYDSAAIEKILPHRYPMLLVDKIIEMDATHIIGVKQVTMNENIFQGHFPGNPIMPGVLQIEALAQTGGILCISSQDGAGQYDTYFMKIDNCRFKRMIKPGDTMVLKMELSAPIRRGICEMKGTVYVNGKVATEADLVAQIALRK